MKAIQRLAWFTLGWNVFVILWGAVVRSTGSGAGCGRSWPTCQGTVVPELQGATAIEFGHRMVSGVALLLVLALGVSVFRGFPAGHVARKGAVWTAVSIVVEALIGAMIVFFEWVADDASVARAISVPVHLVNTFLLLAVLTLTIFWISGGQRLTNRSHRGALLGVAGGIVVVAATGGITALADTLFPKDGFTVAGVFTFETSEHFLTNLRVIHPVVSVAVGVLAAVWARRHARTGRAGAASVVVAAAVAAQILIGSVNVLLDTPVWLTLIHLLAADILWVAWIWMAAELSSDTQSVNMPADV